MAGIRAAEMKTLRIDQFQEQSAATSNRNLFILKQVFKHGLKLRSITSDPAEDIQYLSEKDHEHKRFLKPDQIVALVMASRKPPGANIICQH
jgi:hypothetical protein